MPMYAYRNGRRVVTRSFRVSERPETIVVDGKTYRRSFADERPGVPSSAGWPMECVASGVHSSQAADLRRFFREHGCPTEVSADGNPIYRSAAHRRKALKPRGFKDKSSYI
jgi:hypothetical protein